MAMYDGPFMMVMSNSAGWDLDNLGRVVTHETGHIFWACDEYYDLASNTGCFTCGHCLFNGGPRNQQATPNARNANGEYTGGIAACDIPRVDCVMRRIVYALCPHTPAQVGW